MNDWNVERSKNIFSLDFILSPPRTTPPSDLQIKCCFYSGITTQECSGQHLIHHHHRHAALSSSRINYQGSVQKLYFLKIVLIFFHCFQSSLKANVKNLYKIQVGVGYMYFLNVLNGPFKYEEI